MGTDLDIPTTVDSIEDLRSKIAEHFKPTECEVRTRDGDVVVELNYQGFEDYATAAEHVADHALRLEELGGCDNVHFSASNHGGYDPDEEEKDPRPSGHINATFTPSPTAEEPDQ